MRYINKMTIGEKIRINWDSQTEGSIENNNIVSLEPPRPELDQKLQSLASILIDVCEMDKQAQVYISGIATRRKDNEEYLVIYGGKWLPKYKTTLPITTPRNALNRYNMSEDYQKLVKGLEEEIFKYIDGDRAQGKLL